MTHVTIFKMNSERVLKTEKLEHRFILSHADTCWFDVISHYCYGPDFPVENPGVVNYSECHSCKEGQIRIVNNQLTSLCLTSPSFDIFPPMSALLLLWNVSCQTMVLNLTFEKFPSLELLIGRHLASSTHRLTNIKTYYLDYL